MSSLNADMVASRGYHFDSSDRGGLDHNHQEAVDSFRDHHILSSDLIRLHFSKAG